MRQYIRQVRQYFLEKTPEINTLGLSEYRDFFGRHLRLNGVQERMNSW